MNWTHFLNDIFLGDTATIGFVKRLVGYIASGEKEEQIIPIIYGPGRNGKTTFIDALQGAMGRGMRHGGSYVFGTAVGPMARPDLVALRGVKMLAFEGPVCHRDFAMNLNSLASEGQIVARPLYESEIVSFRNTTTPVLVANEIPNVFFRDKALGKRVVIIPFGARFTASRPELKFNRAVVRAWIEEGSAGLAGEWPADPGRLPHRRFREEGRMSRRKLIPGRLSLFQASAPAAPMPSVPAAAAPAEPTVPDVVPSSWATIPQPEYFRDGRFWLPPGIKREGASKHWYCVCHPDGSYRDAVAILYVTYDREEYASVVLDCPALGRRWEDRGNWIQDVLSPSMSAMSAHAAELLGLTLEEIRDRAYVTLAWRGEDRPVLRDVSHLGNVRPRVPREETKEAVNG